MSGQGLTGIRVLPANQDDEREPHQQEEQAGEAVLKTDDLVIGGKNPAERVLESYPRLVRPQASAPTS